MNHASSLVDFLDQYKSQYPKDVFLVNEQIDVEYESTAHYKLLEEKNPLIWFSKVKGGPCRQSKSDLAKGETNLL